MFAISNEELKQKSPARKDGKGKCPNCKKLHKVEFGKNPTTGEVSTLLGFVKCPKDKASYVATIDGKSL